VVGLVIFCAAAGCVTFDAAKAPAWPWTDKPAKGEVTKVIVRLSGIEVQPDWAEGGVRRPGPIARVHLFGPKSGEALEADGTLIICLYDDLQAPHERDRPRELWRIDPENLKHVLRKDMFGWGYDLWLPWRTYNPAVRHITLLAYYEPQQGGLPATSAPVSLTVGGAEPPVLSVSQRAVTPHPLSGQQLRPPAPAGETIKPAAAPQR
jgi:hypothetical protein